MRSAAAPERPTHYKITLDEDYLRAELHDWKTADETQKFLGIVAGTGKVLHCGRFFIAVHSSMSRSMLDKSSFLAQLKPLGTAPEHKIAVLGDALDPASADECIQQFTQQHDVNVRAFADEETALQWVRDRRLGRDRRHERGQRIEWDRRLGRDRRPIQNRPNGQAVELRV